MTDRGWAVVADRSSRGRARPVRLVGAYVAIIFGLLTLNFLLPRAMPGDPISILVSGDSGRALDASSREAVKRYYGLDRPLRAQYASYLGRLPMGTSACPSATAGPWAT